MDDWFERNARKVIAKAIQDAANWASAQLTQFLSDAKPGVPVSQKPLIVVIAEDAPAHTKDFLLTGDVKISNFSAFARVATRVDTQSLDLSHSPPVNILAWPTILGDVHFSKEDGGSKVIDLALHFQREGGVYGVGGTLFLTPFPRLAAYGAFGDGKFVVSVDARLPPGAPIALGPTGLAIWGVGGTFAHNFEPRLLAADGMSEVASPTAGDYVRWARNKNIEDQWKPCTPGRSATGLGLNLYFGTVDGFIFMAEPAGLSYLTPGALIIGGEGRILKQDDFKGNFFLVLDIPSGSVALSVAMSIKVKVPWGIGVDVFSGNGQLDLFFSFKDPTAWYFNVGREDAPVRVSVLEDVPVLNLLFSEQAEAYLQINHHRIALGAKVGMGGEFKLLKGKIKLIARLSAQLAALVARDPFLVKAVLQVAGELGVSIWEFDFLLEGKASPTVYFPQPRLFAFDLSIKLDMPWPIPDVGTSKHFGDELSTAPTLSSPMNVGHWKRGGATQELGLINGQHLLSMKQFQLDMDAEDKAWPDIDLLVPFAERVGDATGLVLGSGTPGRNSAGYDITQTINKLEIFDETHQQLVSGVGAVWEDELDDAGQVERSVLHVLGTDPFSWITPQVSSWSTTTTVPGPSCIQFFGDGPDERFGAPRRFERLRVHPASESELSNDFVAALGTRVLRPHGAKLAFLDIHGAPVLVDQIDLYLVLSPMRFTKTAYVGASLPGVVDAWDMAGGYKLVQVRHVLGAPADGAGWSELDHNVPVYAVGFRVAATSFAASGQRTLLLPGKYTVRVEGRTTAVHPDSQTVFPPPEPVDWSLAQTFETTYPSTARPYIFHASFGDTRLFSKAQPPWSQWTRDTWQPALYGFGFPAYRHYERVVRFLVPYADQVFPSMQAKVSWSDGASIHANALPLSMRSAFDGVSSMTSPQAHAWLSAHGGSPGADLEAVLGNTLPAGTQVNFSLQFKHPAGGVVDVDSWSFYSSEFSDFTEHLAWDQPGCLTIRYTPDGRMSVPSVCAPIASTGALGLAPWLSQGIAINRFFPKEKPRDKTRFVTAVDIGVLGTADSFPEELTHAPATWMLPGAIQDCFGPLDATAAQRFVEMAVVSGARFGRPAPADRLDGLLVPPSETELVALTDSGNQVIALWLRTPEPVDWRRVSASLQVRHAEPASGCPTAFAKRHPLVLEVAILPSPDGASAFLGGRFSGDLIHLPRGYFELTLRFHPSIFGLPPLYPTALVGPTPENVVHRFIQPLGASWPLPTGKGQFRFDYIELLRKYVEFDPHIWERGIAQGFSAEEIEQQIRASLKKDPRSER